MRYRLDPAKLVWREVDQEIVAVDLGSAEYLSANPTAVTLWPLLDRGATVDEMSEALSQEYDVSVERVRPDVVAFVESLQARELVTAEG